jgi:hypothetical protein
MPVKAIDSNSNLYPLVVTSWNPSDHKLSTTLLESVNDVEYPISYPLSIVNETENFSDYHIYILKNRFGSREDQYFRLQIDGQRLGIIFPIKVYSDPSQLPLLADDEFLYRFLYIAYYHLLYQLSAESRNMDFNELTSLGRDLKIEDFYDDEVVILLYHDPKDPTVAFELHKVYPSLFKHGYVVVSKETDYLEIEMLSVLFSTGPLGFLKTTDWLKLESVKNDLMSEPFVLQLFESTLKYALTPLVRFILLYQVIELLINRIGLEFYKTKNPNDSELAILLSDNLAVSTFRDLLTNVKRIKNKFDETMMSSEESRIRELLDNRCKLYKSDYAEFETMALLLISTLAGSGITDFLYPIRNKIIHGYHSLTILHADIDHLLNDYNRQFEILVSDIILSYT